jgi:xylose isomerase
MRVNVLRPAAHVFLFEAADPVGDGRFDLAWDFTVTSKSVMSAETIPNMIRKLKQQCTCFPDIKL